MNLLKISALVLSVFLVACGGSEKSSTSVEDAKKAMTESANKMKDEAQEAVSETAASMEKMGKEGADAMASMKDKAAAGADAMKDKAAAGASSIAAAAEATTDKMADKAKDAVSLSKGKEMMDDMKDKGKEAMDDMKDRGKKAMDDMKDKVKTTASAASQKADDMVKETTKAATSAPKIVEKAKEEVAGKAAAAAATTAAAAAAVKQKATPKSSTVDHGPWDQLLRKHVTSAGKVNYAAIKANQSSLDAYLKTLSDNPVKKEWSRNEKMAYWINAYNAYTIKLIVDNYPVKSITDLHGGKPWDHSWIKLGSKTYTLNDIEHKILRPQFKDARIHFAVNCAAASCPPVLNRAWTAGNLNSNLEKQTKKFINDSKQNSLGGDVAVSKIFDWYKEDFGDLTAYLNKYANSPIAAGTSIGFKEYDWALNKQ